MQIEIECGPDLAFEMFELPNLKADVSRDVPGNVTIEMVPSGKLEKRDAGSVTLPILILATAANAVNTVALSLFSNWLYDKITKSRTPHVRINKRTIEEITPDGIRRIIEETTEYR